MSIAAAHTPFADQPTRPFGAVWQPIEALGEAAGYSIGISRSVGGRPGRSLRLLMRSLSGDTTETMGVYDDEQDGIAAGMLMLKALRAGDGEASLAN